MSGSRPLPPHRVPTLTEVVEFAAGSPARTPVDAPAAAPPAPTAQEAAAALTAKEAAPDAELLTERVFAELQRQVDVMLESRLREALTPLLARTADALIQDVRAELATTLHEIVARAVAQEMERQRGE